MQTRHLTLLTVFGIIAVAAGLVGIVFLLKPVDKLAFPVLPQHPVDQIAVVGEEVLYVRDLEAESSLQQQNGGTENRELLIEKLVNDSVILQAGKEEGIIQLTDEFYNQPDKDYAKRAEAVEEVKWRVSQRGDHIQGAVVSIRFRSNDYTGPEGLEKSRQIALEKISGVHRRIVDGELTIDQAGAFIIEDESLYEIDPLWRSRALFHFDALPGKMITFNPDFDALLWELPTGGLTDVYLARDPDSDAANQLESLYYLGQVTSRTQSDSESNFEAWAINKRESIEVTVY